MPRDCLYAGGIGGKPPAWRAGRRGGWLPRPHSQLKTTFPEFPDDIASKPFSYSV
jgi:hypothetical protein